MKIENNEFDYKDVFLSLMRSVICKETLDYGHSEEILTEVFPKLFTFSNMHDLSHMIAFALNKLKKLGTDDIGRKFLKKQYVAVCRYEQTKYEQDRIYALFEKEKVAFIPLKGAVIRKYYPEEWMRTSCDIDILVKQDDLQKAQLLLVNEYNYYVECKGSHDITLISPNKVRFELHYSLIEQEVVGVANLPLENIWQHTRSIEGKEYHREMENEYFYYYHVVHMAKHFLVGGCGIRTIMDLYILNHNMSCDGDLVEKLLKDGNLTNFENQMRLLSEVWFGTGKHTALTKQIEKYVFHGGVYGSKDNLVAVKHTKKGGNFKYILYRIWPPYNDLKYKYPILQKYKWLLPVFQIKRWFRVFLPKTRKKSINTLKISSNIPPEMVEQIKQLLEQLEI